MQDQSQSSCRTIILEIVRLVGQLSEVFQWKGNHYALTPQEVSKLQPITDTIHQKLNILIDVAKPIEYQEQQIILPKLDTTFSPLSFEELRIKINNWCSEREWEQYHTPRNLVMALVGEVGELSEIFGNELKPGVPELNAQQKQHLGEELSDVLHNLIRLSDRCQIDLAEAIQLKMIKNSKKYPIQQVKGSNKKYDEYNN